MRRDTLHVGIHVGHGLSITSLANVGITGSRSVGALLSSCTASTASRYLEIASCFGSGALVATLLTIK